MDLSRFDNAGFDRGRSATTEAAWRMFEGLLFNSWLPGSIWRVMLLRMFGAKVGTGVVFKPHTRVKFPWKLKVGDHSWIGEGVWIDNLDEVSIGSNCCISQGAYLCTGNHRWDRESFDLETKPIEIKEKTWIGAKTCIGPGVTVGEGSVVTLGSIVVESTAGWSVYAGNPAIFMKARDETNWSVLKR